MISLPDILPYPQVQQFDDVPELHRKFVYIIKKYPLEGLSIVVVYKDGFVVTRFGDFEGNIIDPTVTDHPLIQKVGDGDLIHYLTAFNQYAKIEQCQYYLSDTESGLQLVDIRISLNKFAGPGYINDFLGRKIKTQEVFKIMQLNDENVEALIEGKNNFSDEYIVKPSSFKFVLREDDVLPMYGQVTRGDN